MVGLREERVGAQSPEAFRHAMGALQVVETPRPLGVSLINYALKRSSNTPYSFPHTRLSDHFGWKLWWLCQGTLYLIVPQSKLDCPIKGFL